LVDSKQHTRHSASKGEDDSELKAQNKKRVLVVDDSMTARTLARDMLHSAGYEVAVAVDGEEAWTKLQSSFFSLVVSDIQMPKVDGFELTKRIRTSKALKNIPVVLVTTLGTAEDIQKGAEAGADEYFIKGQFDRQKLIDAVERLI